MTRALLLLLLALSPAGATTRLIVLHTVDKYEIVLNAEQVTTLREAHEADAPDKLFTKEVACMIGLTDGRYVTVTETCEIARTMIDPQRMEEPR